MCASLPISKTYQSHSNIKHAFFTFVEIDFEAHTIRIFISMSLFDSAPIVTGRYLASYAPLHAYV